MKIRFLSRSGGRHRAGPARPVVDMAPLRALIASGDAALVDGTYWCPNEEADRWHEVHKDGSRTCWSCYHQTEGTRA